MTRRKIIIEPDTILRKTSEALEKVDNELRKFLEYETQRTYPVSPTNKTITIEISFQSKG